MCLLIFMIYRLGYGLGESNAFAYMARSSIPENYNTLFFYIYLAVSMTFSPFGEELFYRGVIHEAFRQDFGEKVATFVDSSAFALTHLAHFGIVYTVAGWRFLPIPALIWLTGTFLICIVFNMVKRKSGSLLGPIITHAGFNFAMGLLIFYAL